MISNAKTVDTVRTTMADMRERFLSRPGTTAADRALAAWWAPQMVNRVISGSRSEPYVRLLRMLLNFETDVVTHACTEANGIVRSDDGNRKQVVDEALRHFDVFARQSYNAQLASFFGRGYGELGLVLNMSQFSTLPKNAMRWSECGVQ